MYSRRLAWLCLESQGERAGRPAKFLFAVSSQRGQKLSGVARCCSFVVHSCPGAGTGGPGLRCLCSHVDRTIASTDSPGHPHLRSPGQVGLGLSDSSFLRQRLQPISEPSSPRVQFDPGGRERGAGRHGEGQRVLRRPGDQH